MITNTMHTTSVDDVELRVGSELTAVGSMGNSSVNDNSHHVSQQSEEETIGQHLERNKVSLYYYYQVNFGSLYQIRFADASLSQRVLLILVGILVLMTIQQLLGNVARWAHHGSIILTFVPSVLILVCLITFPVKLVAEMRLQQKCRLPPEIMRKVVMHAYVANVLGFIFVIFEFVNLRNVPDEGGASYIMFDSVYLLLCFTDVLVIVSSTSWVIFMIIYNSHVIHMEIEMIGEMARNGKLTGLLYMQHYRRIQEVNAYGHLLHECLVLVSYCSLLVFGLVLLEASDTLESVSVLFLLLGREGCVVLYLLPFFSSTNESFNDFLGELEGRIGDADIQCDFSISTNTDSSSSS